MHLRCKSLPILFAIGVVIICALSDLSSPIDICYLWPSHAGLALVLFCYGPILAAHRHAGRRCLQDELSWFVSDDLLREPNVLPGKRVRVLKFV